MPQFIEQLIPRNIDKDVSPGGIDYSGRRVINPLRDCLNTRYLSSEGGESFKGENIKGTILPEPELVEATIGALSAGFNQGSNSISWSTGATPAISFPTIGIGFTLYSKVLAIPLTGGLQGLTYTFNYNLTLTTVSVGGWDMRFKVGLFNADFSLSSIVQEFATSAAGVKTGSVEVALTSDTPAYVGLMFEKLGIGANTATINSFAYDSVDYSFALPAGTNKCIGWYENIEKNFLIYLNYNSNNDHGIYKFSPDTNTHSAIIEGDLEFLDEAITGIDMIGDLLSWCQSNAEIRYINTTRAYGTLNDQTISLLKIGPKTAPEFTAREDDTDIVYNRLVSDSFQFAHQYVYLDNEESVMSPFSKLCTADLFPETEDTERAKIEVTHTVDSVVFDIIKEVRLLYRKNNDPNWYVWKTVTEFASTINEFFFNNEQGTVVPSTTTDKRFDLVPNRARALSIFKNRVFVNVEEEGYTFDPPTITADFSVVTTFSQPLTTVNLQSSGAFLKKNGTYLVGIFFRDAMGRLSGITAKDYMNGGKLLISESVNLNAEPFILPISFNRDAYKIDVTVSGIGPPNSQYFIALTEEQNYTQYMQVPAHIMWYSIDIGDIDTSFPSILAGNAVIIPEGGKRVYLMNRPDTADAPYSYIHLLLPKELTFLPDTDCHVRFAGTEITKISKVQEVIDGTVISIINPLDPASTKIWDTLSNPYKGVPFIEIFKLKTVVDPFFYQVLGPYNTDENGTLLTTSIQNIDADTWYLPLHQWNFEDYKLHLFEKINGEARKRQLTPTLYIECPAPTTKNFQFSTIIEKNAKDASPYLQGKRPGDSYTPDLTKSAWSKGWQMVETKAELIRKPTTIRFSDPYIEGSKVNGLNSFPFDNEYNKIGEDRSPITKLVPVGDILLAVHERNVTSLYIGQAILKSGENNLEAQVDRVIGDDRILHGNYGSYHPESVQVVEGAAFGWDIFKGCVWRYTVEGVLDISQYGMKNYFREKAEIYRSYRDEIKFTACIDRYHKEYIIVFPTITDVIEGETWAFNYKEKAWTHRYSFVPEMIAHLGNKVYGFVDGILHEHNADDDTYNNFYGEQFERNLRFECNPQPNKNKVWNAIQIAADTLAADDTGTKQVIVLSNDRGQESYVRAKEFEKKEGVYYGPILKDVNTNPSLLSAGQIALRDGKDMRSKTITVTISNDDTGIALLQKINIVGQDSEFSI